MTKKDKNESNDTKNKASQERKKVRDGIGKMIDEREMEYELQMDVQARLTRLQTELDDLEGQLVHLDPQDEQFARDQADILKVLDVVMGQELPELKEEAGEDVLKRIGSLYWSVDRRCFDLMKRITEGEFSTPQKSSISKSAEEVPENPEPTDAGGEQQDSAPSSDEEGDPKQKAPETLRKGGYISSISIENFKGIGEKVTIPLKPITLMFGANSAGKSTVLQALMAARSVIENDHWIPEVDSSGSTLKLGSFYECVHDHDIKKNIMFQFDYQLDDDGLPFHDSDEHWSSFDANELMDLSSVTVRIIIKSNRFISMDILHGGEQFVHINYYKDNNICFDGNEKHPLWRCAENKLETRLWDNYREGTYEAKDENDLDGFSYSLDIKDQELYYSSKMHINKEWELAGNYQREEETEFRKEHPELEDAVTKFFEQTVLGPIRLVYKELDKIRHIGPMREVPPPGRDLWSIDSNAWFNGSAAWKKLHSAIQFTSSDESEHLVGVMNRLDWFQYTIKPKGTARFELAPEYFEALQSHEISNGKREKILLSCIRERYGDDWIYTAVDECISLIDKKTGVHVEPSAVGIGISQVLPVIVSAVAEAAQIVAVEQPELHIHPKLQCELGDLFISQMHRYPERTFLLETHSEHLILRLLRRIRETASNELKDPSLALTPDDVGVLYVDEKESGVRITELPINEEGDFTRKWPQGFFDERAEELF